MYKIIVCTLSVLAIGATSAFAQSSASSSATISATVISALSITKNQDLAFGNIAQGQTKAVAVTDAAATKFTVTGQPSTNVTVTYAAPADLTNGGNNLPFTSDVRSNTADNAGAASALSSGDTFALSASGNAYVYLGGSLTAGAAQALGAYSGSFTIQVDY